MVAEDDFFLDGDLDMATDPAEVAAPSFSTGPRPAKWMPLFFDIETVPDEERLASFDLPPLPPLPAEIDAANLPNPADLLAGTVDAIKATLNKLGAVPDAWVNSLAEAERDGKGRAGVLDAADRTRKVKDDVVKLHEERRKLLSTCPEYCQVAALGWAVGDLPINAEVVGHGNCPSERHLLEAFWKLAVQYAPAIAFNGLAFDLPVILARSAILGVQPSKSFDLRPASRDLFDPYIGRFGYRGNTDKNRPGRLKLLAKVYGIDVPAGDVEGSQVYDLMQSPGGRETVAKYVASDVQVLRALYHKLAGYFWV